MEELASPRTQYRGNPRKEKTHAEMDTPQRSFTVRRNPPRRAKLQTPMTLPPVSSTASLPAVAPLHFPAADPPPMPNLPPPDKPVSPTASLPAVAPLHLPADDTPPLPNPPPPDKPSEPSAEFLRVFLRIRPEEISRRPVRIGEAGSKAPRGKSVWPRNEVKVQQKRKNKKSEICLIANDTRSVMLTPPVSMQETKRAKIEVYEGFSHVFSSESNQNDVYGKVMAPLVSDFLEGKSGLLAAMGPTGSGKTHTMFGTPREPGMVPLALQHLFPQNSAVESLHRVRSYYFSMFEICSERGKGEKIIDLTSGRTDIFLHQSTVKGLQEVLISSVTEAECVISQGMLRRATASTNSNDQSSRSQCIINIRNAPDEGNRENYDSNIAVLTIVDLAGAERERKTGNQGERLMESGFINNTFMIFGHCLRSLLEHQKNPKKPIQKHFLNSLLTRYLRDYLEGKKRLTLILTAKSTADDYLDTSFLLRQTLSYMKIKFLNTEESLINSHPKRSASSFTQSKFGKKQKCTDIDPLVADAVKNDADTVPHRDTDPPKASNEIPCPSEEQYIEIQMLKRSNQIMQGLSRALWNVLQQYKQKLRVAEGEVKSVKDELNAKDVQIVTMAKELEKFTFKCCSGDGGCMHSLTGDLTSQNHNVDGTPISFVSRSPREGIERQCHFVAKDMDSLVRLSLDDSCCLPSPTRQLTAMLEEGASSLLSLELHSPDEETRSQCCSGAPDAHSPVCLSSVDKDHIISSVGRPFDLPKEGLKTSFLSSAVDDIQTTSGPQSCFHSPLRELSPEQNVGKKCPVSYVLSPAEDNSSSHICKGDPGSLSLELESQNLDSAKNALIQDDLSAHSMEPSFCAEDVDRSGLSSVLRGTLIPAREPVLELAVQIIEAADSIDKCPLKSTSHKKNPIIFVAQNADKPRRRLRPASAVLLKEFSGLDVDVENVNTVMGAEKKIVEGRQRSKGSLSLVHILTGFHK